MVGNQCGAVQCSTVVGRLKIAHQAERQEILLRRNYPHRGYGNEIRLREAFHPYEYEYEYEYKRLGISKVLLQDLPYLQSAALSHQELGAGLKSPPSLVIVAEAEHAR
jgi:hypothetical protein